MTHTHTGLIAALLFIAAITACTSRSSQLIQDDVATKTEEALTRYFAAISANDYDALHAVSHPESRHVAETEEHEMSEDAEGGATHISPITFRFLNQTGEFAYARSTYRQQNGADSSQAPVFMDSFAVFRQYVGRWTYWSEAVICTASTREDLAVPSTAESVGVAADDQLRDVLQQFMVATVDGDTVRMATFGDASSPRIQGFLERARAETERQGRSPPAVLSFDLIAVDGNFAIGRCTLRQVLGARDGSVDGTTADVLALFRTQRSNWKVWALVGV